MLRGVGDPKIEARSGILIFMSDGGDETTMKFSPIYSKIGNLCAKSND